MSYFAAFDFDSVFLVVVELDFDAESEEVSDFEVVVDELSVFDAELEDESDASDELLEFELDEVLDFDDPDRASLR